MEYPNFIGGAYRLQSPLASCQETINFYVSPVQAPGSRNGFVLDPTPGQQSFLTTADVGGRAALTEAGRTHVVQGAGVYEVFSTALSTKRGTVVQDSRLAYMVNNGSAGNQILIVSGGLLTYLDLTSNALTSVTGLDATNLTHVGMIDGFFAALDVAQNRIYVSPLNDQTAVWDPTQFIQRTTQPDGWKAMRVIPPDIWAIGEETGDVLYDAGFSPFPLAPRPGITFRYGIIAPDSLSSIGNSLLWLARDKDGAGIVVQTRGYQPQPVSDKALEFEISNYARTSTITDAESMTYQLEGHYHYVLSFPTARATWDYDTATQRWTRVGTWLPALNGYVAWGPRVHTYNFGRHLVSDRTSGVISTLDVTFGTESGGSAIRRVIVPPPLWKDSGAKRMFIDRFEVLVQPGLGTQDGQGQSPTVMMETSRDLQAWSNQRTCSAGAAGQYLQRVFWLMNGSSTMAWAPRLTFSDPIPWRVIAAEFDGRGVRGAQRSAA